MPRTMVDSRALYQAVDKRRRTLGLSWRRAAEQITGSVNPSLPARLRAGRPVSADMLCCIMVWLGDYDIRPYLTVMRRGRRYAADIESAGRYS